MSPRGNVWNHLYLKVTKTTPQIRDTTRSQVYAFAAGKKNPIAKAAVDKEWKKLETIPAWNLDKVRSKKEVILEAQKDKKKVHFVSLMDTCHLKIAELEPHFQKYNGRVVLRGDIVKDDSGSFAVFTEQGSSASQMTAAIVMDIISRLPGCSGQAADAVSAYTQVKMTDAPQIAQNSKVRMSRYMDTSSTTQMAQIMNDEDPVVLL